ncbi:MAG: M18 family aminopeptidase [Porticoccaceae bacterium]|nr:M18 family aminopeptidase [Porticoccaceae bacterium]|tara:strand:- start:7050 stop:8381 length:1332 start_codon:yes stop_codon:yes gene_type:complete
MTIQNHDSFNADLVEFLDASPTPFHAVLSMKKMLLKAGFTELNELVEWTLEAGNRHFVTRNGSSIIAFVVGQDDLVTGGIRLVGAHTDSPCLMVKPQPEIVSHGYFQLGVEVYGGALLNPWFDRDLSIAGRVVYKNSKNQLKQKLVDFKTAVATIPSLAIHLDRNANSDHSVNAQTDIIPILMLGEKGSASASENPQAFRQLLSERFLGEGDAVLDYELCLYDTQPAAVIGLKSEFITSARLDNLLSCFVGAQAMIGASAAHTCLLVCNDHEEVGSVSAVGADGPFLENIVGRLSGDQSASVTSRIINKSLMMSCDNAHAAHPNFSNKHDSGHLPKLNGGPVVKVNVKQRYATTSLTSSLFRQLCAELDIPVQTFVSRNDLGCGSTIGPVASARLGVPTLDVGIPQLAMHSCREITGADDPLRLTKVLLEFFNKAEVITVELE